MLSVKIEQLLSDRTHGLELTVLAGRSGMARRITVAHIQKPGLALTSYTKQINHNQIQILDASEIGFLQQLSEDKQITGLDNLLALEPACLVVTRGLAAPPHLVQRCDERNVALLTSPL